MAKKKKKNIVKIKKSHIKWALLVAVLIIAAVILWPMATKKAPEPAETNLTELADMSKTAELGDLVTINYVLRLDNGKLVDTNNEELAKEAGLQNYVKGPFKFILGQSNKLPTFDKAVEGLTLGEKKTIMIKPVEPVLVFSINITDKKPRRILFPRVKNYPLAEIRVRFSQELMKL